MRPAGVQPDARLPPERQPLRQHFRQTRQSNLPLCLFNGVGNPEQLDLFRARVDDGETGSWVPVPRLTHRTRVDQVPRVVGELERRGVPAFGPIWDS